MSNKVTQSVTSKLKNMKNIVIQGIFGSDGATLMSDSNPIATKLTGRKVTLSTSDLSQVLNINASGYTVIAITPPIGELWKIKLIRFYVPAPIGATTGTNEFRLYEGANSSDYMIVKGTAAFNMSVGIQANILSGTYSGKSPSTDGDFQRAILNLEVSNQCPLYIYISNNTDTVQNQQAIIRLVKEVEYIV